MAPETWWSWAFSTSSWRGLLLLLGLQLLLLLELVAEGVTAGRSVWAPAGKRGPGGQQGDEREGHGRAANGVRRNGTVNNSGAKYRSWTSEWWQQGR